MAPLLLFSPTDAESFSQHPKTKVFLGVIMKNLSLKTAVAVSLTTLFLGACSNLQTVPNGSSNYHTKVSSMDDDNCGPSNMEVAQKHMINNGGKPVKSIKIRVTGYGAPPKSFYPDPQRRLMAMRAAKIDAYRSLAERVTGVQIWGGTTIGDMVVEKDRFRVYLDTHLTGARVIAENPQEDGTYESVVELKVGQSFLKNTLPQKVSMDCSPNNNGGFQLTKARAKQSSMPDEDSLILSNFYIKQD